MRLADIQILTGLSRRALTLHIKKGQLKATLDTSGPLPFWVVTDADYQSWWAQYQAGAWPEGRPRKVKA